MKQQDQGLSSVISNHDAIGIGRGNAQHIILIESAEAVIEKVLVDPKHELGSNSLDPEY